MSGAFLFKVFFLMTCLQAALFEGQPGGSTLDFGKKNEPAFVRLVAECVAEIRGMTFDEVAKVTTENAKRFFGI